MTILGYDFTEWVDTLPGVTWFWLKIALIIVCFPLMLAALELWVLLFLPVALIRKVIRHFRDKGKTKASAGDTLV